MARLRLALVAATLAVAATSAVAHHSGSEWGGIYVERYLVCADHDAADKLACVGPAKGKQRMLAKIKTGDRDAIIAAIYANDRDAIPLLRDLLAAPAASGDGHAQMESQKIHAEAADALAYLGDTSSAGDIEKLTRDLEVHGYGTLWEDTLAALARIDASRASKYAIDFLGRASDFRTSMPGGSDKLRALDYILPADASTALPVLTRLAAAEENGYDFALCNFQSVRAALDPKFHAEVRKLFAGSYSGTWLAGCDNVVMKRFGTEAADAEVLLRHLGRDDAGLDYGMANTSYAAMLAMIAAGHLDTHARDVLTKGLAKQATYPHIADPRSDRYALHFVAYNLAVQAGLGDTAARDKLYAIVDDARDTSGTAWLAAYWALRLGLPGAEDHAASLVARGATAGNDEHGGIFEGIRVRVLDAFADRAPDDARWTPMLLDHDGTGTMKWPAAAERAYFRISRHAPKGTCAAVASVAISARPSSVEYALLALTNLGTQCQQDIVTLADDSTAPSEVRGAALEIAAVLEVPDLCTHLDKATRDKVWQPAIDRARGLHHIQCGASKKQPDPKQRHGDQPLPPTVYRQGF